MPRTIEINRKKPGRPPKYPYGTQTKTFRFPTDLDKKLKEKVEAGLFESETEAIYHYVMFADKLDELFEKIRKLERRVEILEAENGALRQKITLIEGENKQLKREKHELLKELESVISENMRLKKGVQGESKEEVQKEEITEDKVLEAIKKYLEFKEKIRTAKSERELIELQREQKGITDFIDSFLKEKGVDSVLFYKTLNFEGFEKAKKMILGGENG